MIKIRRLPAVVVCGVLALLLAACSGGGGPKTEDGAGAPLEIFASDTSTYQANFNPFSPNSLPGTRGMIYAPLMAYVGFQSDKPTPILAERMEFNDDGTELTITLRDDLQWADGEALTTDDVVYTFDLMKDDAALNTSALPIKAAKAVDEKQAVITFTERTFALLPSLGNQVIVPEHLFAEHEKVGEWTNEKPVGSGPYALSRFTAQEYSFERSEAYVDADEVDVPALNWPAMTSQTFTSALTQGKLDWAGGFVANVDQVFVQKDPEHNAYWFPGAGLVHLILNNQNPIFDDLELRQAISLAVDRQQLSDVAMAGHAQAANPAGLVLPAHEAFDESSEPLPHDAEEANAILDRAGYKKGANGIRTTPDGEKLSFTLQVPTDYVDWIAMTKLLEKQMATIGIEMTPRGGSSQKWIEQRSSGNFDVTMSNAGISTSPYFYYRGFLSSELSAPKGESASSNFARWEDVETDKLLDAYAASDDEARQREAIVGLGRVMAEKLPVVPLINSPTWGLQRTANYTGFPSEQDPYANPTPYTYPDNLLVVLRLKPVRS